MKIVEGFKLRKICGENVVVPEGAKLVNFNKMLSLNETAAYLWEAVQGKECDAQGLADLLSDKYDVAPERALSDAQDLLAKWQEVGVVE